VKSPQVWNRNETISAPIAFLPVSADSLLGRFWIWIIAVVENHQLNIAEQDLYKTNRMLRKQEVIQNDSCG